MENEILQQILDTQKQILNKVGTMEQDISALRQGQTRIEIVIENDIKPQIKTIAEQHGTIIKKLDGLPEKVRELQDSDKVQNVAIHELARRAANK